VSEAFVTFPCYAFCMFFYQVIRTLKCASSMINGLCTSSLKSSLIVSVGEYIRFALELNINARCI
jgi:hypothetical protein